MYFPSHQPCYSKKREGRPSQAPPPRAPPPGAPPPRAPPPGAPLHELPLQEPPLQEHQSKVEDNKRLLEELARMEEELIDRLQREVARQRELNVLRQEDNRLRWRTLCFLQLNQRLKKPVVTSYYKNIPMHIYCLPIQTVGKGNSNKKKKKKKWQR
uniref:espin-like n=1 Tax=Oncorhynchus gorbuscha TaxID=8017 RepID=UPI001EAECE0B|nr:espin-like [Oncorhynchus gorbuscha]